MKTLNIFSVCRLLVCLSALVLFSGSSNAQFTGSTALFIVADAVNLNTGETNIVSKLEGMGFAVTPLGQAEVIDESAEGMSLVVISATVTSGTVATNMPGLKDLPVPIINWEPALFDDQGFQAAAGGEFNTMEIEIVKADHPLAAGLPVGPIQVSYTTEVAVSYGKPEGDPIIIAVSPDSTNWAVHFGYEKGAAMAAGNAPARRVGTFLLNNVAGDMSEEAWALFDSSVVWAMGPKSPSSVGDLSAGIPPRFALYDNYPNPFNPATHIAFSIPIQGRVRLSVWDALGEKVATLVDEVRPAGSYTSAFNASEFSSGVFFYRIEAGSYILTKKMLLLK